MSMVKSLDQGLGELTTFIIPQFEFPLSASLNIHWHILNGSVVFEALERLQWVRYD